MLLHDLASAAENEAPFLHFLDRSWSRAQLWAEAEAAAPGLLGLGLDSESPCGLILPNVPAMVPALFGLWLAGVRPALIDPRKGPEALRGWLAAVRPEALITLDLATVHERALLVHEPGMPLIVMPMAGQLSPLKRLIAPFLRGGGVAVRAVEGSRDWDSLKQSHASPPPPACLSLALSDAAILDEPALLDLAKASPGQGKILLAAAMAEPRVLGTFLAAWRDGGEIVLSPRLDRKALQRVAKAAQPDIVID